MVSGMLTIAPPPQRRQQINALADGAPPGAAAPRGGRRRARVPEPEGVPGRHRVRYPELCRALTEQRIYIPVGRFC